MEDSSNITEKNTKEPLPGREFDHYGRQVFKKGFTGNPNGRPKGTVSIVAGIKEKLEQCPPGSKKTYRDIFIEKVFEKANADGDVGMMKDIINRVDGMPQAHVDLTSDGEKLPTPIYGGQSIEED